MLIEPQIPGRPFPLVVFTSLAVYLSSWLSLFQQSSSSAPSGEDRKGKDGSKIYL